MKIRCPLCYSFDVELIYRLTIKDFISKIDTKNEEIEKEIKRIWKRDHCKFMKCRACTFSFAYPFRGGTPKLYSLIYKNDYHSKRWEYNLALKDISKKGICLEIGSGESLFLELLLQKCKSRNLYSLEISNQIVLTIQ